MEVHSETQTKAVLTIFTGAAFAVAVVTKSSLMDPIMMKLPLSGEVTAPLA